MKQLILLSPFIVDQQNTCKVFTSKVNNQPLWWDNHCAELKYAKYKFLQEFRKSNVDNDYKTYIIARNNCKALCKKKQLNFEMQQRLKLIQSRSKIQRNFGILLNVIIQ